VLKGAVELLTAKVEELEKGGARPTPSRPTPAPKQQPNVTPQPKRPQTAAPSSSEKYATLPKGYRTGALADALKGGKEPTPIKPGSASKPSPALPKVFQPRTVEEDKKAEAADEIPANRRGFYTLGNKKIFYALPAGLTKDDAKKTSTLPDKDLVLEHIHGYNGKGGRDNLFFNPSNPDEIIYSIAGSGVVMNLKTGVQRFFLGHNEDILSLAIHPTKGLVATGQLDPKGRSTPYVCIWDINTMAEVQRIVHHDRGVIGLAFSPDGKYLLTMGNDDNHTVAIWNWETVKPVKKEGEQNKPLVSMNCSKDQVFCVRFNNTYKSTEAKGEEGGSYEFVTLGVKHFKIWNFSNLDAADAKNRKIGSKAPATQSKTSIVQKAFHSVVFIENGDYVLGTQSGHIYRMRGVDLVAFPQAHGETIVGALAAVPGGYASVGDDGFVKVFTLDDKETANINIATGGEKVQVRSMDFHKGRLLLGQKNNTAIIVDIASKSQRVVTEGHFSEVWGLDFHKQDNLFATGGHDGQIRLFDANTKSLVTVLKLSQKVRSVAFSNDGKHMAVGTFAGKLILYSYNNRTFTQLWEKQQAKETIDSVAFSPDNSLIAAGSWDQNVHVLSCPEGKVLHTLRGHTSSVLMIQFSSDGKQLLSASRDYEILIWDIVKGKRINHVGEYVDTKWQSWNSFLGWPVAGIWADCGDGTDINAVDRSPSETLLAAGDDYGKVRLYRYPAMTEKQPYRGAVGHSAHVPSVRFSPDESRLISVGGGDCGVFQWRIVDKH